MDLLNKRIIEVMVKLNHSKSSFASALEVSLPLITHITTGRNKPGIELIQRILTVFNEINPRWLLLGEGEMYEKATEKIDYSELKVQLNQFKVLINNAINTNKNTKEYHKILLDELLYLQELDIKLNESAYELGKIDQGMEQMRTWFIEQENK